MDVHLIAQTVPNYKWATIVPEYKERVTTGTGADRIAEFAGRACYQSWNNPSGRTTPEYIANIVEQGHYSVLEHASCTFYITGVSRALTHELIRHRHLSYSQLSQRFVDEGGADCVLPPGIAEHYEDNLYPATEYGLPLREEFYACFENASESYRIIAEHLIAKGVPRKQAREAARAVLPNMTETRIVVTGNHRAWREFLQKRWSTHADAEIRQLAGKLLEHLRGVAPATYADIPNEPFE